MKLSLAAEQGTLSYMTLLSLIIRQENRKPVISCTKTLNLRLIISPTLGTALLPFEGLKSLPGGSGGFLDWVLHIGTVESP